MYFFFSAYFLWNSGYEIWLSNSRGTQFSERHVNLSALNVKYWDFSFHEMGLFDLSSQIELIRSLTNNSKIIFVGHSMGTTVGLIYASLKPREAEESISTFIYVAPTCFYKYNTGIVVTLVARFRNIIQVKYHRPVLSHIFLGICRVFTFRRSNSHSTFYN